MSTHSEPEVFIIESLKFKDERRDLFEGRIISGILALSNKQCRYYYVRTRAEFLRVLDFFEESRYRYLHVSCHANATSMATTLDSIPFRELAKIFRGRLAKRRLFVSACSMASEHLADALIPESGCTSILGPSDPIGFGDATIFWSALYHQMFKADQERMPRATLELKAGTLANVFGERLNLFLPDDRNAVGHRCLKLGPRRSRHDGTTA